MLKEKKSALQHGEWLPWVQAYFEGSERQAQRFMELYTNRDKLPANPTRVSEMGFREALRAVSSPPKQDETQVTSKTLSKKERGKTEISKKFAAWANAFAAKDAAAESREPGVIAQPGATTEWSETYQETPATEEPALWSPEEEALREWLEAGATIVINMRTHTNLMHWADERDLFVRITRPGIWGNPYILHEDAPGGIGDGHRDECVDLFRDHYLPYKRLLHHHYGELVGKALGCWCHPERCHGHVLVEALRELGMLTIDPPELRQEALEE
jgi:Domain of unknown function (DUF4326)/Protein of unknown function (DUF3102)